MLKAETFKKMATTPTGRQEVEIIVWDDDTDTGIAYLPDLTMVGISIPGRSYETETCLPDLAPYEDAVIFYMRACISAMDIDPYEVNRQYDNAHCLFGALIAEWSEAFGNLYNSMLEVYRAKTPRTAYTRKDRNIPWGLGSTTITTYKKDKVQPVPPTAIELLVRFDQLISTYRAERVAA